MIRHVFHLTGQGLAAYHRQGRHLAAGGDFASDEDGLAAFSAYLAANPDGAFRILVDLADEDYRQEDIPPLSGRERRDYIARRRSRHFAAAPYVLCRSLGRLAAGRHDETLCWSVLTSTEKLAPWLLRCRQRGLLLAGIHAAPQELAGLFPAARATPAAPRLLLSLDGDGLRQTCLIGNVCRFSRLTPLADRMTETLARNCAGESRKLHQYLRSQGLLDPDAPLTVQIPAHPDQRDAIARIWEETAGAANTEPADMVLEFIDPALSFRRQGTTLPAAADFRCDTLLLHRVAGPRPGPQFAPTDQILPYRRRRGRRARLALCLAFGLAELAAALFIGWNAVAHERQAAAEEIVNAGLRQRHATRLAALPAAPVPHVLLLARTEGLAALVRRSPSPHASFERIGAVLERHPALLLDRLRWSHGPDADENPGVGQNPAADFSPGPHFVTLLLEGRFQAEAEYANEHASAVDDFARDLAATTNFRIAPAAGDPHRETVAPGTFRLRLVETLP